MKRVNELDNGAEPYGMTKNQKISQAPAASDSFEEIRKYKQLLDEGVITEEDFNLKKQQLLRL